MTYWRAAGINYIRYSQLAANAVRRSLKQGKARDQAMKDEGSNVRIIKWKDGKQLKKDV